MKRVISLCLSAALAARSGRHLSAQTTGGISIIPRPASLTVGRGSFVIDAGTTIWADRADSAVACRFARTLAAPTGFELPVKIAVSNRGNRIVFQRAPTLGDALGAEGYRLDVAPGIVTITSSAPAGAFYATQTIRQPLPPVARHFMPKEFVEKYIDLLALHKMNTFHWHLTDDQGWRIEIKTYPRLTDVGAWRSQTLIGHARNDTTGNVYDHTRYGGFYTQDDVREIVAYAADRFVRVVPEIEMPGHSQAAIASYPELGNFGDTLPVWTMWGITPHILNPSDSTIAFMENVLTEVMALFPSPFIHTGGGEAPKTEWKASPRAQARMKALGLQSEDQLQGWFTAQIGAFLTAHGRRLVGWDEILDGGLAPNAVVMSWRGTAAGLAAARAGHDVVMAPESRTYFDHYQSLNHAAEPLAIGGYLPLDSVYSFEPVSAELEPRFVSHILGAQGQVWTEYIDGPKNVEYMSFPRMCALAEVLWTPRDRKSFADFETRLPAHLRRLDALHVNYRR